MDISKLKEWMLTNDIEKKAIEGFWINFNNYRIDSEQEFKKYFGNFDNEKLLISIQSISLKLENWPECNYNHVVVSIQIIYNNSHIGSYDAYFDFNSRIDDDYFVIF